MESLLTVEEEGRHLNSFYKVIITLTPKPDKDIIRKLQNNITTDIDIKVLNETLAKESKTQTLFLSVINSRNSRLV